MAELLVKKKKMGLFATEKEIGLTRSMKLKKVKRYRVLFLMTLPGIIYLLINNYLPMLGVVIAFKNYNAIDGFFGS